MMGRLASPRFFTAATEAKSFIAGADHLGPSATGSAPIACESFERIASLYRIETEIRSSGVNELCAKADSKMIKPSLTCC